VANLTPNIDAELSQRAREAALRERTSVNALIRESLERYVDARRRRYEALGAIDALAARAASASAAPWTCDELDSHCASVSSSAPPLGMGDRLQGADEGGARRSRTLSLSESLPHRRRYRDLEVRNPLLSASIKAAPKSLGAQ
jgi:hypothetical protein